MFGELLAIVGGQSVDVPVDSTQPTQDGVAYVLGGAIHRVRQQMQTAAGFHDGGAFRPVATVQKLATAVAQAMVLMVK